MMSQSLDICSCLDCCFTYLKVLFLLYQCDMFYDHRIFTILFYDNQDMAYGTGARVLDYNQGLISAVDSLETFIC